MPVFPIDSNEDLLLALESMFNQSGFMLLDIMISNGNQNTRAFSVYKFHKSEKINSDVLRNLVTLRYRKLKGKGIFTNIIGTFEPNTSIYNSLDSELLIMGLTLLKPKSLDEILVFLTEIDNATKDLALSSKRGFIEKIIFLQVNTNYFHTFVIIISNDYSMITELAIQLLFLANKLNLSFINPKLISSIVKKLIRNKSCLRWSKIKLTDNHKDKTKVIEILYDYLAKHISMKEEAFKVKYSKNPELNAREKTTNIRNYINQLFSRVNVLMDLFSEKSIDIRINKFPERNYVLGFKNFNGSLKYELKLNNEKLSSNENKSLFMSLVNELFKKCRAIRN